MALALNQQIFLVTATATAHCAIAVSGVHCVVVRETARAVCLGGLNNRGEMTGREQWFPRAAIMIRYAPSTDRMDSHRLGQWFKPDSFQARWIDRHVTHATLAA